MQSHASLIASSARLNHSAK